MSRAEKIPRFIWRLFRFLPPRILYSVGLGSLVGGFVLLLETTGRKSGLPRITPLQYVEIDGSIYVGSARGDKADWFQNLVANPKVKMTVGSRKIWGYADPITDPTQIADYLEYRLETHPLFMGTLLKLEGLNSAPTREQLLEFSESRAVVAIRPIKDS